MAKIGFHYATEDELKRILTVLRDRLEFVLLERIDVIALDRFKFDDAAMAFQLTDSRITDMQLGDWEEGRAFGWEVELRWRKTDNGQYHYCCLAADDNLPPQIHPNRVFPLDQPDWEKPRSIEFYLWGLMTKGKTDEWIEQRIPRILRYPVIVGDPQQAMRVVLKAEEYVRRDLEDGLYNVEERFVRFKTLCEAPEGGQP